MKQLIILSGKGGSGKTSVTAAFAQLASTNSYASSVVIADTDVDAANLELLLSPKKTNTTQFWGGQLAIIDQQACIHCGTCAQVCRFDAVIEEDGEYRIDPLACEGCGACYFQCPQEAITREVQLAGEWYRSESAYGPLFHAQLRPAQENSGKLVNVVKHNASQFAETEDHALLLVDGPPGIGCPVISAISGADLALIVTEPTKAGLHDMGRIFDTIDHFGIPALVCVNKADLYPQGTAEIKSFCDEREIEFIGEIPYDMTMIDAMIQGEPVIVYQPEAPASQALMAIWARVSEVIDEVPA